MASLRWNVSKTSRRKSFRFFLTEVWQCVFKTCLSLKISYFISFNRVHLPRSDLIGAGKFMVECPEYPVWRTYLMETLGLNRDVLMLFVGYFVFVSKCVAVWGVCISMCMFALVCV